MYESINECINQSINPSISLLFFNQTVKKSINQSIHPSINRSDSLVVSPDDDYNGTKSSQDKAIRRLLVGARDASISNFVLFCNENRVRYQEMALYSRYQEMRYIRYATRVMYENVAWGCGDAMCTRGNVCQV